jgi:hypothetical protein
MASILDAHRLGLNVNRIAEFFLVTRLLHLQNPSVARHPGF